ncbi:MAG: hypothetical protein K0R44_1858, partial [Thermomicrobiales bacterium]|nr:hypothetical protein [Thermomicrobiales bacterium]
MLVGCGRRASGRIGGCSPGIFKSNVRCDGSGAWQVPARPEEKAEIGKIKDTVVPRLGSISALGNDHVQIASLRGGGRCCSADPHQQ